jgi:hypothetical protein
MNMQNTILPKVISQMFAHSHHALKLPPVDHINIRKPPLRSIHTHRPSTESRFMARSPSMNLISFRHRLTSTPSQTKMMATALVNTRTTVATPYQLLKT